MQDEIPKIIHYCWFGGNPLPKLALKCIESWKKYLPDYEIRRWDESNFNVNIIPYTSDAYKQKKYAFVSDYARFWILYNYGGIYLDTDVEIINSMDDIIKRGPFMGCEYNPSNNIIIDKLKIRVATGLGLGCKPHNSLIHNFLEFYNHISFESPDARKDAKTVVTIVTDILVDLGLKNNAEIQKIEDFTIYPQDYFCPISIIDGKCRITNNTKTIHHYDQSWQSSTRKYFRKIILKIGGVRLKNFVKSFIYRD